MKNCRVPEIGEDLPDNKNPLQQDDGLPEFNNVTIEHCMAAIGRQTLEFETDIKRIEQELTKKDHVDFIKDVVNHLEKHGSALDMTWGIAKTLYLGNSALMPTKSYIAIHERAKRARATKYNSPKIYRAAIESLQTEKLAPEEERVTKKFVLEGKLNGLLLDEHHVAQLTDNLNKQAQEKHKFKIKYETITRKFNQKIVDHQVMAGFPRDVAAGMSQNPNGEGPWVVNLQPHIYQAFMEYCPDRTLRWNAWNANVSRGSGYGDKEYENSTTIQEIRFLRQDQAKILGFKNYGEVSMETKMAGSVENVQKTIGDLLLHAKPAQDEELKTLLNFATDCMFKGERIELWDYDYWKRKQCRSLFEYDDLKLQEYFPLNKVLDGLFDMCENLFDVKIKQRANVPVWHKDVRFFDVFESHSSAPVAGFYFDPYARSSDKSHMRQNAGWMVGIQNHSRIAETKPLAALVFNFQQPIENKPSLLTFQDLQTLYYRFGQTLQHILSRTTFAEVSGLSNIEWDAVEVTGHVLSMSLLNKSTIDAISSHYLSEDKLPQHMFDSLVNVQRHTAGTDLCKELYLSALDLELHTTKDYWLDIVKRMWPQYRSFPLDKVDSHPCNFHQVFYDEWAAAYFSRVWSKMIAADVYSAFHEVRGQEKQTKDVGKRFRDTFLALGGGTHPNQVFRNFRGRDPSPKALIASLGLKKSKN